MKNINKGDIVKVKDEQGYFIILESHDEQGDMPRILVKLICNLPIKPTYRIERENIVTLSDAEQFRGRAIMSNFQMQ